MYKLTENQESNKKKTLTANNTKVGELMRVLTPVHINSIILHTYDGFVSLTNPRITWSHSCNLEVELLKSGKSITLTVK